MRTTWQRRLERARELAVHSPVLPEVLDFYCQIASFQCSAAEGPAPSELGLLLDLASRSPGDAMHAFFSRVLLQARVAAGDCSCVNCDKPVAAVLRSRRFLLCGTCFGERESVRSGCQNCGQAAGQFRIHADPEFPHIRLEACGVCRVYLKTIDVTMEPAAVPEVDELASVVLDLWAAEHGFIKLQPNLFGM